MKKSLKPSKPYCSCKFLMRMGWKRENIKCKCKPVDKVITTDDIKQRLGKLDISDK